MHADIYGMLELLRTCQTLVTDYRYEDIAGRTDLAICNLRYGQKHNIGRYERGINLRYCERLHKTTLQHQFQHSYIQDICPNHTGKINPGPKRRARHPLYNWSEKS
ncbi:hypothetical protein SDC9_72890 [bioreactor metagenome]|uniref:Uncharacterized protein n=1 Tax=bioreactor metagenome TaxID=1076179 RepID=A0A644YDM6_9ZZZZ